MAIRIIGEIKSQQDDTDEYLRELKTLQTDLLYQIILLDLDYLYELQEDIDNLISNYKEFELALEDDD